MFSVIICGVKIMNIYPGKQGVVRGIKGLLPGPRFRFLLLTLSLLAISLPLYAQTELGSEDDLTVLYDFHTKDMLFL